MKGAKRGRLAGIGWMVACLVILFAGCQSYQQEEDQLTDTPLRGTIHVSADESFKPVVDALVQVYESNHPGTHILVQYKPEAECLKDLLVDSIRVIIATRGFSQREENAIVDSLKLAPDKMVVAHDAIAVIVHPQSADSLFTMQELKAVLTGRIKKNLIPVFDGVQATSTVRFIVDSILRNDSLSSRAMAARSSEEVINYVAGHPQAVGLIGVSWIGNKDDTDQRSFLKKVKVAHLESADSAGVYILPVQEYIYLKRYPMVRDLVYILKEGHRGLGHGFTDFMSGQIGQLIFKRAYLVAARKNFILRPVKLSE